MAIYIFNYFASSIIRYTDGWLSKQIFMSASVRPFTSTVSLVSLAYCRGKHVMLTQLSSQLIHIRLVPIVIGCLFRVTKKLGVIIDDITLKVSRKNASCNESRRRNLSDTLFV